MHNILQHGSKYELIYFTLNINTCELRNLYLLILQTMHFPLVNFDSEISGSDFIIVIRRAKCVQPTGD